MALSLRYYLFPAEGDPRRLAKRVVDGLTAGTDSIPEYAGTRQKVVEVVIENVDGQPEQIVRSYGTFWSFDEQGGIGAGLRESIAAALDGAFRPAIAGTEKVVDLTSHLTKKRARDKHRWQPSPEDLDRIAADIWPKDSTQPRLKEAKGTSPKPPPVTREARYALSEASEPFWRISHTMDNLTEAGLAGFAHEARTMATEDECGPLYRGLAELAERRLEILKRRRSGKGTWYAFVEIIRWSDPPRTSESIATYHRQCEGRKAAVAAARELLQLHASEFADNVTVEAGIETDLEWDQTVRSSSVD